MRNADTKLVEAQYHGEGDSQRKVAGLRSWRSPRTFLATLVDAFGNIRLTDFNEVDIEEFRARRLRTPVTRTGKPRTIASVNRELEVLRASLNFAQKQGWCARTPHIAISKADEVRRTRVLSNSEEGELLAACVGRRAHLKPLLICALDTGMRRGEMFRLERRDVDLERKEITVRAVNTKTASRRVVPIMTSRLASALEHQLSKISPLPDARVFQLTCTVKNSFGAVCREAGINDFRVHDCRHTAITRMVESGVFEVAEIIEISGHTQFSTFRRYVNPTRETKRAKGERFAVFLDRQQQELLKSETIN